MVSFVELKDLCDRYRLTPVYSRPFGRDYTLVSLNFSTPPSVDIQTSKDYKRHCDVADYHDVQRPWRPYIPAVVMDAPENYIWLSKRLFDREPQHFVTESAPFRLTTTSSRAIASSLSDLKKACGEMQSACAPLLTPFKSSLPPQPTQDIFQPVGTKGELEAGLRKIGPQLLEVIGL